MGYAKNKMIEDHNKELAELGDQLKFLDEWAKGQPVYIATQDDVDIAGADDFEDFISSNPTIHDSGKKQELKELFLSLAKFALEKRDD